jgi:hypothetical protein
MKLALINFFFLTFNFSSYSQVNQLDIVGIWQSTIKELNSGWFDNYQFFFNGKFRFNTNQSDATRRIITIGGNYKIIKDTLVLEISFSKEIKGGFPIISETAGSSGWEIQDGKIVTIKYKSVKKCYLLIENSTEASSVPCILINKIKHYKLENNPNNY